jgi:predicted ABC-type transport system involved in lysophospholipase L1 biosynthesis ATPase subunit
MTSWNLALTKHTKSWAKSARARIKSHHIIQIFFSFSAIGKMTAFNNKIEEG